MSIKVCIPGIAGRMGLEIAKVLLESSNLELSSGILRDNSKISKELSLLEISKEKLSTNLNNSIKG